MNQENEKDWNPGHSTHKGYPYAGVATHQAFPDRNNYSLFKDKDGVINLTYDIDKFQEEEIKTITNIAYNLQEMLAIAEGQIIDILDETPFFPEKFGFELVANNGNDIHNPPVQIYVNKFDESISLYRTPGDSTLESFNPTAYTLVKKKSGGIFNDIQLSLPCARIAYAALYALGVQMTEKEVVESPEDSVKALSEASDENEELLFP